MTILTLDYCFDHMQQPNKPANSGQAGNYSVEKTMSIGGASTNKSTMGKRPGKRPGRKPSKIDERAKLERSRQSARECRARKKLRYQYLEELVLNREKAVFALRDELETCKNWCSQLERGGPVPDALVKMIVNEDMKIKQRQQEQSQRSLEQQQKQLHQRQISTSSSSSSASSPPSLIEQQLNLLHQQQGLSQKTTQNQQGTSQSTFTQSMPSGQSVLPTSQSVQTFSTPVQQHQMQQARLHQLQKRQATVPTPLKRQMAFDQSHISQPANIQIPQTTLSQQQGSSQSRFIPITHTGQQQMQLQQQQQQQQMHSHSQGASGYGPASTPIHQTHSSQSSQYQRNLMVPRTQSTMLSRVKSEPPLRYSPSLGSVNTYASFGPDNSLESQGFGDKLLGSEGTRARSLSNPVTRVSLTKMDPSFTTSANVSTPNQGQTQTLGLFSGANIPSINIPQAITIEDSCSSDENISEQQLFQSTLQPQKRTLSDPIIHTAPKRARQVVDTPQPMSSTVPSSLSPAFTSPFDPHATLSDLTTVHCFSATGTSNTSSPSSFGIVPSNSPSSRKSNLTPSSSASASPAPLSSLTSLLDLCPSPAVPIVTETSVPFTSSVSVPTTVQCTTTGLSASIAEPIPEWYSFLADLEDGSHATLSSRHGASSNQSTPLALTPKQMDQPDTPDPNNVNVPNIIDELLDSDPTL